MYSTKNAQINADEFVSNYIPVGINDDIYLKEVNVKKSPTDKDFLEIVFENKDGQTVSMSEWKNEKNMWIKTDEDLQKRDNIQFGRIMQIISCFYDKIEDKELNSFSDMINWVKEQLTPMIATKKALRLKVVYDKKGYTTVSPNGIFVEPMSVETTQIKKFARDSFERLIKADDESTDPLASVKTDSTPATSGSENNDVLPF